MSRKPRVGIIQRHIFRSFKYLDHGLIFIQLHNTSHFPRIMIYNKFHDLIVKCIFHAFQYDERAINAAQSKIFYCHLTSLPLRIFLDDAVIKVINIQFIQIQ